MSAAETWLRPSLAEALGTFALVFAGTGAVVSAEVYPGTVTHLGVAVTFGLVVMAVIQAIGDVSGAHINPAVTLAFWAGRQFPGARVAPYLVAQCVGAAAASLALAWLFPQNLQLGATVPQLDPGPALAVEGVLTAILMFVVLGVSTGSQEKGITAGLTIGGTVGFLALFAGPMTGASMNPARSLGPALASGVRDQLWIYLLGPVAGALLAVALCRLIRGQRCCSKSEPKKCGAEG